MTARQKPARAAEEPRRSRRSGTPQAVHVIEGEEPLLVDEAVDALVQAAVPPAARAFNLDLFSGDDESGSGFLACAQSYPFMAERRAVVVRRFEKMTLKEPRAEAAFFDYLRHPAESTVLILVASKLDKRLRVTQALLDSPNVRHLKLGNLEEEELPGWVRRRCAARRLEVSNEACDKLVRLAGPGLLDLDNEITKIALRYGEGARIGAAEIGATVGKHRAEDAWAMARECDPKNMSGFLRALALVLETGEPINIASVLGWQLRAILRVKLLQQAGIRNPRDLQSRLRARNDAMPGLLRQADAFSTRQLALWIRNLQRADVQMKSVKLPQRLVLERAAINSFLERELS